MSDDRRRAAAGRGTRTAAPGGFQRVLVALDLSPISDRVLARLALLPLAERAQVTLLHVVPRGLPLAAERKARRDAAQALAEERSHLAPLLPGARRDTLVLAGSVASEIASCAQEQKAELVLLGRGGRRALRDVFLGSTAERVIRRTRQPVLAIRGVARTSYQRPAAAVALDRAAPRALALLEQVTAVHRPPLTVIHAVDAPLQQRAYPSLTREEAAAWREDIEREAARELDQLLAALPRAAGTADPAYWKTRLRSGSARRVIAEAVKKLNTDLLVLGTHGYSGAAHVLLGTVAGDVLRDVACDVLLVPGPR